MNLESRRPYAPAPDHDEVPEDLLYEMDVEKELDFTLDQDDRWGVKPSTDADAAFRDDLLTDDAA